MVQSNRSETRIEPFLQWLLLMGLVLFGLYVAWYHGLVQFLLGHDPSHLSLVIALLFAGASVHAAAQAWALDRARRRFARLSLDPCAAGPPGAIDRYLAQTARGGDGARGHLVQVLVEELRGSHDVGWYLTGLLTKLGLLGTVIGFIMMMQSVGGMDVLDATHAPELIQRMTRGMGVALITTLVGLLGSIGLGLQFLLLDRQCDRLIAAVITHAEATAARDRSA